ncbi:MAG: hypothetical protein IJU51_00085 [Clostridia bacterium]|nr:hypothetical protein [Clostridia bacterium]
MSAEKDRGLLEALCGFLSKNGCTGDVVECEGIPVMVMEYNDKDVDLAEYFNITVEHISDDTSQLCIMHTLFSDIREDKVKEITAVIGDMNRYRSFGSYGIDRFNRNVLFCSALDIEYLGKEMPLCFTVTFDQSRQAANQGVKELAELLQD